MYTTISINNKFSIFENKISKHSFTYPTLFKHYSAKTTRIHDMYDAAYLQGHTCQSHIRKPDHNAHRVIPISRHNYAQ